jgi:serine/threonine-protein kinase
MEDGKTGSRVSRTGLAPGTVLNNNYRIEKQLGEGGMGAVYLASNTFLEEDRVAIKVIRTDQAHDDLVRQMFGKEVRAMLRLNNPRIVSYRTFAHDPVLDLSFIVTEYIDGPSLEVLMKQRPFYPRELCTLLTEICIGLRAAHKEGVVHRDLAPDNVLLEEGDLARPKIIDFGIVKDARANETIIGTGFAGKLNFVAPEQLGDPEYPIGPWTDIYSLALMIVGLARGAEVDMGSTPGAAIRKRHEPIDLAMLDPMLRPLIRDMLAVHPEHRLRSVEGVMMRIDEILRVPEPLPEPPLPEPPTPDELDQDRTVMLTPDQLRSQFEPEPEAASEYDNAAEAPEEQGCEAWDEDTCAAVEYLPESEADEEYPCEAYECDACGYSEEEYAYQDEPDYEYDDGESDRYQPGGNGIWLVLLFAALGIIVIIAGVYFG